jgi:hypothetical protein
MGTCYLIHFDPPYKHAKHYLGWTANLGARLNDHAAGNGSRLCQVATDAGCTLRIVRVWTNVNRHFERNLHDRHGSTDLCPICNPKSAANHSPADSELTLTDLFNDVDFYPAK